MKILVIDDETLILTLVRSILEADGHEIRTYTNAERALLDEAPQRADLIICDVTMPYMNGIMFAREVLKTNPSAKILMISGYHENTQDGNFHFLKKPFTVAQLKDAVAESIL